MNYLTMVVLGFLGLWVGAMLTGQAPTDFALFLLVCTLVSGAYYAGELAVFAPRRRMQARQDLADFDRMNGTPAGVDPALLAGERHALEEQLTARPWWVEYTAGFFPVIAAVFMLRSFLVEPFRIPSGSMIPTLQIGDLILVNKFEYGLRLPVANRTVVELGKPARGDVVVFRYPHDTTQDYIKRVVGLPGDVIEYRNHALSVNGEAIPLSAAPRYEDMNRLQSYAQFTEHLGKTDHSVIFLDGDGVQAHAAVQHTNRDACVYSDGGVRCVVPPASYFVMGDNRDNSEDSRFWGFVPDRNIVGHAFFIWMNFTHVGRIGRFH
jgi:signal peptidase I